MLQPLERVVRQQFLPSLTSQNAFSDDDRDLLALPVRLGGLGIFDPCRQSTLNNSMSEKVTALLVAFILQQSHEYTPQAKDEQLRAGSRPHFVDNKN